MWNLLPGGLLMPAAVPMDKADPKYTHDGKFDLQVRGRVVRHLENFINEYMEPGTYSEIQETPGMDYNARFYTTREAYADGMRNAILDIDYKKFKPTAERRLADGTLRYGPESVEYHSALNSMWSTLTRLGSPGGIWGVYSKSNPNGYKPGTKYSTLGRYGSTYGSALGGWHSDELSGFDKDDWGVPDYSPYKDEEQEIQDLLEELDEHGVPTDQWERFLSPREFLLVKPLMSAARIRERKARRRVRRALKRSGLKKNPA